MLKKKLIFGFSLAEALITLLVVCIITLASIPVITKKKRTYDGHGKWICTLNSSGQHIMWTNGSPGDPQRPSTWSSTGKNYCEFVVPARTRNFAITAVGGGGGGAGAEDTTDYWSSDFAVRYYGIYRFAAVGGGGQGGRANCGRSGGGGSGGIGYTEYDINENITQVKISKGRGGNGGSYNGSDGTPSVISVVQKASSGNMEEIKILKANGGVGGGGRYGCIGCCGSGSGGEQGRVSGLGAFRSYNSSSGRGKGHCGGSSYCGGCISYTTARTVNNLLSPYSPLSEIINGRSSYCAIEREGRGGDATSSSSPYGRAGVDGYALAMTEIYYSGEGGKAGEYIANKFYPSFNERKFNVTIGAGGKGGSAKSSGNNHASNGENGKPTVVGNLFGLNGGKGGKIKYEVKALKNLPGGDGEKTPLYYKTPPAIGLGGLSGGNGSVNGLSSIGYGAGGGGGGMKPNYSPGKGADGAPGYVLIEW